MARKLKPKRKDENYMTKMVKESAHQIWLAGLGALAKTQAESTRLFETLVKEGEKVETHGRDIAESTADEVKKAAENKVEKVKGRASDTWDKLETVFEDRVSRALNRLGVPTRDDIQELSERVDALHKAVKELTQPKAGRAKASPRRATKKAASAG